MAAIEICGYSERGVLNALCYEIRHSANGLELLRDFLKLCNFPDRKPNFDDFRSAKLVIEQSFSDFGDLDLLVLLDGSRKQSIFLEAKVKTDRPNSWGIQSEWAKFKRESVPRSNLFLQLYRKMRLIRKVQDLETNLEGDAIASRWSLGENRIVRKAAVQLSEYCSEAWLVALVPDSRENVHKLFQPPLSPNRPDLPDWQSNNVGYLTWQELDTHCRTHPDDWPNFLATFEYNRGQIFGVESSQSIPPPGTTVTLDSANGPQEVVIKNRNTQPHSRPISGWPYRKS